MENHITAAFEFPSLSIFCYGEQAAISSLEQFFNMHTAGNERLNVNVFLARIVSVGAEAYAEGKDIKGIVDAKRFNKYFSANKILLTEEKYLEMVFYWNPGKVSEALDITDDERAAMIADIEQRYFSGEGN